MAARSETIQQSSKLKTPPPHKSQRGEKQEKGVTENKNNNKVHKNNNQKAVGHQPKRQKEQRARNDE